MPKSVPHLVEESCGFRRLTWVLRSLRSLNGAVKAPRHVALSLSYCKDLAEELDAFEQTG